MSSYYKDKIRFVNFIVDTTRNRRSVPIAYFYSQSLLQFGFGKKTVDAIVSTLHNDNTLYYEDEIVHIKKVTE